jgi:hypothetical protein
MQLIAVAAALLATSATAFGIFDRVAFNGLPSKSAGEAFQAGMPASIEVCWNRYARILSIILINC